MMKLERLAGVGGKSRNENVLLGNSGERRLDWWKIVPLLFLAFAFTTKTADIDFFFLIIKDIGHSINPNPYPK